MARLARMPLGQCGRATILDCLADHQTGLEIEVIIVRGVNLSTGFVATVDVALCEHSLTPPCREQMSSELCKERPRHKSRVR
jgi:hypothetical protein